MMTRRQCCADLGEGGVFQAEAAAGANTLGQEHTWFRQKDQCGWKRVNKREGIKG